jgi:hypothetical protein
VQVADGAAQETGAEVEAEDEGRFRDGLEEDGAVARPAGVGLGLAHKLRLEERLQREGNRRLRDSRAARDLGPRDRGAVADRLEDGPLVQVLQERRDRSRGFVLGGHFGQEL